MKKYRVYLGLCDTYDSDKITRLLFQAVRVVIPEKPISGRIVIKPNLVMAHPKVAPEAYTRPEVVAAILNLIEGVGQEVRSVDIVEKSGLGVTTASMFRWAGYRRLKKEYGVGLCAMEERPRQKVVLEKGKAHRYITLPREMVARDFLIFAPKLKTNVLSNAYTGALKLNIGICDSKERLQFHDFRLPVKIVDLLEAANPDLVITDGIRLCYGGNQMTQGGADFGVIAVGNNAVAHDMVCASLLGLNPLKIDHIREAAERGYGPRSLDEIDVMGDFPMEKGVQIAGDLDFGYMPVDEFPSNFTIHSGTPYCTGGCQGIFLDWLHMIKDRSPGQLKRFPKIDVVIGKVDQALEARTLLLMGNCAQASPNLNARRLVKIPGCPPTHKMIVLFMMLRFLLFAPLVRISLIFDSFVLYPIKRIKGWFLNL